MSEPEDIYSELTPSYRTLDEPTRLLGLSVGQIGALGLTMGVGYLFLLVSPLPWRANFTLVVAFGGGPLILFLLREQGALSASRLVGAITRWRLRSALLLATSACEPAEVGGVYLDEPGEAPELDESERGLAYLTADPEEPVR